MRKLLDRAMGLSKEVAAPNVPVLHQQVHCRAWWPASVKGPAPVWKTGAYDCYEQLYRNRLLKAGVQFPPTKHLL